VYTGKRQYGAEIGAKLLQHLDLLGSSGRSVYLQQDVRMFVGLVDVK
jgi:hypothetical protein